MSTLPRTVHQLERVLLLLQQQLQPQDERAKHLCFGVKVIAQLSATAFRKISCHVLTMLLCALLPRRQQLFQQCWRVVDGLGQHRHPGPEQHAGRVSEQLYSLLTATRAGRTF